MAKKKPKKKPSREKRSRIRREIPSRGALRRMTQLLKRARRELEDVLRQEKLEKALLEPIIRGE